ncbi:MAG: hypothetical protein WC758_06230 [Candidatus Woesearchaeota archaeon]|jgi:hypothetical protein
MSQTVATLRKFIGLTDPTSPRGPSPQNIPRTIDPKVTLETYLNKNYRSIFLNIINEHANNKLFIQKQLLLMHKGPITPEIEEIMITTKRIIQNIEIPHCEQVLNALATLNKFNPKDDASIKFVLAIRHDLSNITSTNILNVLQNELNALTEKNLSEFVKHYTEEISIQTTSSLELAHLAKTPTVQLKKFGSLAAAIAFCLIIISGNLKTLDRQQKLNSTNNNIELYSNIKPK